MNWHSVKEAAQRIGLSVDNIYALIASRRIGHRRLGVNPGRGKIQISDKNIADFLATCEVPVRTDDDKPRKPVKRRDCRARGDYRPIVRPDGKPLSHF